MTNAENEFERMDLPEDERQRARIRIIYDDLVGFAEVRLRCEYTRNKSTCKYCPFYNRCGVDDDENLHVMCGEIEKGGESDA